MRRCLLALGLACLAATAGAADAEAQTLADYDYEYLRFRGVGLDLGYIWPDKVENTRRYGLRLDLGYLGPGVRIIPSLGYWRSELTDEELEDLAGRLSQNTGVALSASDLGPIEWSDLSLSVDGHFVWNTPLDVLTYVGAGLGFHALNGQGDAIDDTFIEDLLDAITAGASAMAGLELEPVDRFRVYAEGRYTAMNSVQYLSARAGVQVMFGTDETTVGSAVPAPPLEVAP
jgi:opacity protein-like surface antigen